VQRFHVGDAPMDVMAAEEAGAKAIGVSTGIYPAEELRAAGKGATVLDGLHDLPRVLAELQLT
jgi:phosphoglycolate phosphatase-like HAD superfamily hydrolase